MGEPVIAADPEMGISSLPDYLGSYGLRDLPFSDAVDSFYPGHGRQNLKDQLLHLLHFSDAPTLVTGPTGCGKTALIAALASELTGEDHCFIPDADCYASGSALLFALAGHIGLAVESSTPLTELQAKLNEWVEFSGGNLQVFILIDDAQLLASDAARQLLQLVCREHDNNCWHLLLCAEPGWHARVSQWDQALAQSLQLFSMPEITATFVSDYLAFRLAAVGYDDVPLFDEPEEEQLWLDSGGDLNVLHRLAEQQMAEKMVQADRSPAAALPWLHMGALGLLLAVLVAAWAWQDGDSPELETPELETQALTLAPAPATVPQAVSQPKPDTTGVRPVPEIKPSPVPALPANEPVASASVDPLSHTGGLPKSDPEPAAPIPAAEAPVKKPAAKPVSEPSRSDDERWLLALAPERYVIQVLAAGSEQGVQQFVAANPGLGLRIYRSERGGKPWFVVVQPDYESQAAARAAIQKLPKKIRDSGPWPRSVTDVQQQIVSSG